jgi:lipoprotein signal peptidase
MPFSQWSKCNLKPNFATWLPKLGQTNQWIDLYYIFNKGIALYFFSLFEVIQDSIIPLVSLLSSGIPKVLNSSVPTNNVIMDLKSEFQSVSILTFTKEFNFF